MGMCMCVHPWSFFSQVDQSGLFLPSRDYYLNKTANEKVRGIEDSKRLSIIYSLVLY